MSIITVIPNASAAANAPIIDMPSRATLDLFDNLATRFIARSDIDFLSDNWRDIRAGSAINLVRGSAMFNEQYKGKTLARRTAARGTYSIDEVEIPSKTATFWWVATKPDTSVVVARAAILSNRDHERPFYVGYLTNDTRPVFRVGGHDVGSKNPAPNSLHSVIMSVDFTDLSAAIYINGELDSSFIFSAAGMTNFNLNMFGTTDSVATSTANNGYQGLFAEAGIANVAVHKNDNYLQLLNSYLKEQWFKLDLK